VWAQLGNVGSLRFSCVGAIGDVGSLRFSCVGAIGERGIAALLVCGRNWGTGDRCFSCVGAIGERVAGESGWGRGGAGGRYNRGEMFGSALPELVTAVPGPRSLALAEELSRAECPALTARRARRAEQSGAAQDPISWSAALGSNVRDVDGNVFVDLTGGFGAALFGHAHAPIVGAVAAQQGHLVHALGDVHPSDTKVRLLSALVALAPFRARAILGLSGADAVEAALKTAYLYTKKPGVIAFLGGYHGLSHGPLAACGYGEAFRAPFQGQLNPHVAFAEFADDEANVEGALASAARACEQLNGQAGAILVEPVQGRGGVRVAAPGFLRGLRALAQARGLVLIVDEIYTGLGRSGALLEHLRHDCEADLICLGKGLGGGFPFSACLGREEIMAAWGDPAGEALHTSTFLGNPPACAAALATLAEVAAQDAPAQARALGARLRSALSALPGVSLQGRGALLGVRIAPISARAPEDALRHSARAPEGALRHSARAPEGALRQPNLLRLCQLLLARGYIVLAAGAPPSVLCLTPPLCLSEAQIDGFVAALRAALAESV
jgi:4-aminobutyrate aminotransferase/(S)-3-amino-2-methylpropionate transaminase